MASKKRRVILKEKVITEPEKASEKGSGIKGKKDIEYKGYTIVPEETTQVGYNLKGRTRKLKGYIVTQEDDYERFFDKLSQAKEWIDENPFNIEEPIEKKEEWKPTTRSQKDRIEGSIFNKTPSVFDRSARGDRPNAEERKRLNLEDYEYTYYSISRPLSYLLIRQTMPDAKISESGKYVFTKTPLDLENIYRWELVADGVDTKGQLAVDYYRSVYGNDPIESYKEVKPYKDVKPRFRWQGAVIHPSAQEDGGYRVSNFDEEGFSGHQEYKTEAEAVGHAILDGYAQFQPGLLNDAMKNPKFSESMAAVEKAQKEWAEERLFAS